MNLELNDIRTLTHEAKTWRQQERQDAPEAGSLLLARDQACKHLQGRETILIHMFLKTKLRYIIALIATFVTDKQALSPWNPALKKGKSTFIT